MKVCRICLSKDGRLYPIESNGLRSLYEQLTGLTKVDEKVHKMLPQWVCAECGLRLLSYKKLRQKGRKAHQLLCEVLRKSKFTMTEQDIDNIDREKCNLQSNLSYKVLDNGIIEEYATELQEITDTDWKIDIKVEELVVNLEVEDTVTVIETENVLKSASKKHIGVAANSDKESNFDQASNFDKALNSDKASNFDKASNSDNASNFDNASISDNASNSDIDYAASSDSSISVNTYMKTKNKKDCLEIKKRVDKYMDSLHKKLSKRVKRSIVKREGKKNPDPFVFEDFFTVHTFSLDEQMSQIEKRQYSTNYLNAPFRCDDCFKGFGSKVTFSRHRLYHSDKRGKFVCALCNYKYPSNKYYLRHMEAHKYRYSCKMCSFSSNRRCVSIKHGMKHKGKIFECPHCDMTFEIQSSYLSHLRIKHVSDFVCEFCGFSFLSAKGVNFHKALKHKHDKDTIVDADSPTCSTCDIRFATDDALNTHLRVAHPQKPGAKIRNDEGTARPGVISRPIHCELCALEIQDGRAYRSHFRRYHPEVTPTRVFSKYKPKENIPSMCEQCGRVFKCKANLRMHAVVHSGQKPFECNECDAKYSFKTNLSQHILRAHRTDKLKEPKVVHPCSVCGKKFANSSNRIRHMVLHTDQRPFSCEVCGKSFKSRAEVHSHTAHVHLKKPWPKKSRGNPRDLQCL